MSTTTSAPERTPSSRPTAPASRWGRSSDPTLARLFARFALTGLLAMIVIGAVAVMLLQRSATSHAIREAKDLTRLAGQGIVAPLITPGVLDGAPADLARLDQAVRLRILHGTPIVRVKVWNAAGRIVYSDARSIIGSVYPLDAAESAALRTGGTVADASDLSHPENRSERRFSRQRHRGRTDRAGDPPRRCPADGLLHRHDGLHRLQGL